MRVRQIAKRVRAAHQKHSCFVPAKYLPVNIDPANTKNPYSLAATVLYADGVVSVKCEKGFQWDGASIPYWLPVLPWLATLTGLYLWPGVPMVCVTVLAVLYTLRLLPWMQKIGRHVRAGCVHDRLYREGKYYRAIIDAIFLVIMEHDGVPLDVRWLMYLLVRVCGGPTFRFYARQRADSAGVETTQ